MLKTILTETNNATFVSCKVYHPTFKSKPNNFWN